LRVLRIIARLNIGGPARHAVILDDGLCRLGHETLLAHGVIGEHEGDLEELARSRGVNHTCIPWLGRRIRPLDDVRAFNGLLKLLWRWRPDIVHTHTAKAGALGRLAAAFYNLLHARAHRCGVVHTFHGHVFTGYFGRVGSLAVRWAERSLARLSDCVITISDAQRHDIVSRFAIAPCDLTVTIPLGLELDELLMRDPGRRGFRDALGFDSSHFVIGYVGRLVPIKSVETLVKAVALVRRTRSEVRLLIAGDGEERRELEACVRDQGLQDAVRFLGWQTDLASLYATFDLFALSSTNEGTPVSLIEAMAAGVPVVATSVGGIPDVVTDGVTGILCPPGASDALANAIEGCINDRASARKRADAARDAVASRFNASRLVRDIEVVYRQVLALKRGTAALQQRLGADVL